MRTPAETLKRARRLRRAMSLAEVLLWQELRRGGLEGLQFRRQHPLGPYVLDFYCAPVRLCVEVDGRGHETPAQADHDLRRDAWLTGQRIRILRVPAADILNDAERENVLRLIVSSALDPPL